MSGIRGEGFDGSALSLGKIRLERERRLTRHSKPREHNHLVPWNFEINVFEVMFARALDDDFVFHTNTQIPPRFCLMGGYCLFLSMVISVAKRVFKSNLEYILVYYVILATLDFYYFLCYH